MKDPHSAPYCAGRRQGKPSIMASKPSKPSAEEAAPSEQQAPAEASAAESGEAPADAEALQAALEEARQEADGLRDAALRAQAEVENMRRRTAREVENAHRFALERFVEDLLPVLDSLEKAVESAAATDNLAAVAEGVELSLKLFLDRLGRSGIEQIDPLGEPFDPARQEAMTLVENPDAAPNSVLEVMQKGYLLNGRLVRAAKVIVAKAPVPAPDAGEAAQRGAEQPA